MVYNLKKIITARRGETPPATLPDAQDRAFWMNRDPYDLNRSPGDGKGTKLTTPGSEGMPGVQRDIASPSFGTKEREGYPTGVSAYEDTANIDSRGHVPSSSDPPNPNTGRKRQEGETEYGEGPKNDFGETLHDDAQTDYQQDSAPLGVHEGVFRDMFGENRDRATDVSTMHRNPSKPFNNRTKNSPMKDLTQVLLNSQNS